jgi:hypothetical protein
MKKITVLALVVSILISIGGFRAPALAANHSITGGSNGPGCNDGGYFTPTNITINSGDTITFSVPANDPYSAGLEIHLFPGGDFTVLPGAGGSHTTPPLVIDVPNYYATWPSKPDCKKGTGNVTVVSPTASPPSAAPPAATPPPPPAAPTAPPPPPPLTPPSALKLDKSTVNNDKLDTAKTISVDVSQPVIISGYTIANGIVNLTIHSMVRTEIARANESGLWTFTIKNLEPGEHSVDATVTNPITHQTSPSATLLKFAVTSDATASVIKQSKVSVAKPKKSNTINLLVVIAVAALILVVAIFYWFKKNRGGKVKNPPPPEIKVTPPDTVIAPTQQ